MARTLDPHSNPADGGPLLVGVDGGATAVKAHAILRVAGGLVAGEEAATFRCDDARRVPVPIEAQRRDLANGRIEPDAAERAWGDAWIEAYAEAIASVAARARRVELAVGVCAPGLKTSDARGIALVRHGPRVPDFLDQLESRLARAGLVLAAPIPPLVSDGVACGLGELVHPAGAFRGVGDAYYLGGGTGVAECLLVHGRVTSFDDVASRARKAWELVASTGRTFEDELSMRGLAARWDEARTGTGGASHGEDEARVEDAAARGDRSAREVLHDAALALGELVRARAAAFRLERVVVGQHLGAWLARADLADAWRAPVERASPVPVVASTLRAAPAIGAASRWPTPTSGG